MPRLSRRSALKLGDVRYPAKVVKRGAGLAVVETEGEVEGARAVPLGKLGGLPETTSLWLGSLRVRRAPWLPRRASQRQWHPGVLVAPPLGGRPAAVCFFASNQSK